MPRAHRTYRNSGYGCECFTELAELPVRVGKHLGNGTVRTLQNTTLQGMSEEVAPKLFGPAVCFFFFLLTKKASHYTRSHTAHARVTTAHGTQRVQTWMMYRKLVSAQGTQSELWQAVPFSKRDEHKCAKTKT